MNKFTGDGKEDFEVWLADYYGATGDWVDRLTESPLASMVFSWGSKTFGNRC